MFWNALHLIIGVEFIKF